MKISTTSIVVSTNFTYVTGFEKAGFNAHNSKTQFLPSYNSSAH